MLIIMRNIVKFIAEYIIMRNILEFVVEYITNAEYIGMLLSAEQALYHFLKEHKKFKCGLHSKKKGTH